MVGKQIRPTFYVGLHQPAQSIHFQRCMVSVNRLERRQAPLRIGRWILDSGAFTRLATGRGHMPVGDYAAAIKKLSSQGVLEAAVTQDYMCEPFMLAKTGLTVLEHQRLTIERYDTLRQAQPPAYIMPVLQGYQPDEYVDHIRQYGARLEAGQWVGVGSVCKRNSNIRAAEAVLWAIHDARPDLKLHGFGLKRTALESGIVCQLLHSCDSMAWSYAARYEGRDANDWREAKRYCDMLDTMPVQLALKLSSHDAHTVASNAGVV